MKAQRYVKKLTNDVIFWKCRNLSIKLHSFVHYSPRNVHRIADARYDYLSVDIPRMHKRMQFNAYIYMF